MFKKILYALAVIAILANTTMIVLNGLGVVDYRLSDIVSYVSRFLIVVLIILFAMAVVNVRSKREGADETPVQGDIQTASKPQSATITTTPAMQHSKAPPARQASQRHTIHHRPTAVHRPISHHQTNARPVVRPRPPAEPLAKQAPSSPTPGTGRMPHTRSAEQTQPLRKRRVVGMDIVAPDPRKHDK